MSLQNTNLIINSLIHHFIKHEDQSHKGSGYQLNELIDEYYDSEEEEDEEFDSELSDGWGPEEILFSPHLRNATSDHSEEEEDEELDSDGWGPEEILFSPHLRNATTDQELPLDQVSGKEVIYNDLALETELRGIPQGDPVSPALFCLFMEQLIQPLKKIDSVETSAYADDLMIYSNDPQAIQVGIGTFLQDLISKGLHVNGKMTQSTIIRDKHQYISEYKRSLFDDILQEYGLLKIRPQLRDKIAFNENSQQAQAEVELPKEEIVAKNAQNISRRKESDRMTYILSLDTEKQNSLREQLKALLSSFKKMRDYIGDHNISKITDEMITQEYKGLLTNARYQPRLIQVILITFLEKTSDQAIKNDVHQVTKKLISNKDIQVLTKLGLDLQAVYGEQVDMVSDPKQAYLHTDIDPPKVAPDKIGVTTHTRLNLENELCKLNFKLIPESKIISKRYRPR